MLKVYTDMFPVWPIMFRKNGETIQFWRDGLKKHEDVMLASATFEWQFAKENGYLLN